MIFMHNNLRFRFVCPSSPMDVEAPGARRARSVSLYIVFFLFYSFELLEWYE